MAFATGLDFTFDPFVTGLDFTFESSPTATGALVVGSSGVAGNAIRMLKALSTMSAAGAVVDGATTLHPATVPVKWNNSDKDGDVTTSPGNNTKKTSSWTTWGGVKATIPRDAAEARYFEIYINFSTAGETVIGVGGDTQSTIKTYVGSSSSGYGWMNTTTDGTTYNNGIGSVTTGITFTTGDVVMIAIKNGNIYWGKNGSWILGGNPVTSANPRYSGLSGEYYPMWSGKAVDTEATARFDAAEFTYSPPTGYTAWNATIIRSAGELVEGPSLITGAASRSLLSIGGVVSAAPVMYGASAKAVSGNAALLANSASVIGDAIRTIEATSSISASLALIDGAASIIGVNSAIGILLDSYSTISGNTARSIPASGSTISGSSTLDGNSAITVAATGTGVLVDGSAQIDGTASRLGIVTANGVVVSPSSTIDGVSTKTLFANGISQVGEAVLHGTAIKHITGSSLLITESGEVAGVAHRLLSSNGELLVAVSVTLNGIASHFFVQQDQIDFLIVEHSLKSIMVVYSS